MGTQADDAWPPVSVIPAKYRALKMLFSTRVQANLSSPIPQSMRTDETNLLANPSFVLYVPVHNMIQRYFFPLRCLVRVRFIRKIRGGSVSFRSIALPMTGVSMSIFVSEVPRRRNANPREPRIPGVTARRRYVCRPTRGQPPRDAFS